MAVTEEGLMLVPGLLSRWVRLADGARAHYVTAGESGPNIVLLHGSSEGSSGTALWRGMATFLGANGFRVYCPDLPGFGLSDTREMHLPYRGIHDHIAFIHGFVEALCIERFHLSGNSLGCTTAVQYILAHPDRIASYALIAGTIGVAPIDAPRERSTLVRPPYDGSPESMRANMAAVAFRKGDLPDDLIEMRMRSAKLQEDSSKVLQASRERIADPNLRQKVDAHGRFEQLTMPGIYIHGVEDVLMPVANAYLEEDALPNVQFFYPEAAGHLGHMDRPEVFEAVFLEFFRDGRVSAKSAAAAGVSRRRPVQPALVEADVAVRA